MQAAASDEGGEEEEAPGLVVPPSPEGVAAGITFLGRAHQTAGPERTRSARRPQPPRLDVREGDGSELPRPTGSETGITLTLPAAFEPLFVTASLAYYLGAIVEIGDIARPRLHLSANDTGRELPSLPKLQDVTAEYLHRTITLDRLVCKAVDGDQRARELLTLVEIEPEEFVRTDPGERFARYLDAPIEEIKGAIQPRPLAIYIDPVPERVETLPFLLDHLPAIYLPTCDPVDREDVIERSLADFYRAGNHPDLDVDVVTPERPRGQIRGWLADGVALDAFKAIPTAYENRRRYREGETEKHVTVILNEPEMDEEMAAVEDVYNDRAEPLGVDVTIERHLDRSALATAFERPNSFVHYIGHCDDDGLRCSDGNLELADIKESKARTFLLNACGSYREGRTLVEKGSVAGAVTLRPVLDEQAARVGTAFVQLVMCGFCIERALRIASRRAIMNKDYVAVGDGTYALPSCRTIEGDITSRGDDRFRLVLRQTDRKREEALEVTVTRMELLAYLDRVDTQVSLDGETYAAERLHRALAESDGDWTG